MTDQSTKTTVCLIRHGETEWNVLQKLQGRTDTPLSPAGAMQAQRVAQEMNRLGATLRPASWHGLYSSPLRRALDTAAYIGQALDLEPVACPDLVERAFGALEGLTRAEAQKRRRTPPITGMEAEDAVRARARRTIGRLADKHRGQNIIVVSHGAFLNSFLHVISSGRVGTGQSRFDNAAYTIVRRPSTGKPWEIVALNTTNHLKT